MLGWKIFRHSVMMLWRNLGAAVRISLVPIFALAAILVGAMVLLAGSGVDNPAVFNVISLVLVLMACCVGVVIAVAWHRFILLEEEPEGFLPPVHVRESLSYVGRGLLIFAILLVVVGCPMFLVIAVAGNAPAIVMFAMLLASVAGAVGFYRLAPIAPAAAVGKPLSLKEAWDRTRGMTGALLVAAVCLFGLGFVLGFPGGALGVINPVVASLWSIAVSWITTFLQLSAMTTIYGHCIEGRELQ